MRVVRNIGLVKKRKRRGRIIVAAGLLLLLSSALPLFIGGSAVIIPAYIALGFGFILFIIGTQQTAKWSRRPRADEVLDLNAGRLNDRFTMIHYPELGRNSPEHVLVTPGGVSIITTKDVAGRVSLTGDKWQRPGASLMRFFNMGAPQLGNPSLENEMELDRVEAVFDAEDLPGDLEGVIVFLQDSAEIVMKDPEIDVIHVSELQDYARELGSDVHLSTTDRSRIVDALSRGTDIEVDAATTSRTRKKIKVSS